MKNTKQRETIFSKTLIDKINAPKYHKKRDHASISQTSGIDFNKSQELVLPKPRASLPIAKNLVTSDPLSSVQTPTSCRAKGTFHKDLLERSFDLGSSSSSAKKHFPTVDNTKSKPLNSLKPYSNAYTSQEKQARVSTYMNSSQMQSIFHRDDEKFYRGLLNHK